MVCWNRLIRFIATDGHELRGEPIMPSPHFDLGTVTEGTQLKAQVITGEDMYDNTGKTKITAEVVTVKRLLCPLAQNDVDIIRCVGLNYVKHSKCMSFQLSTCQLTRVARSIVREAGRTPPPFQFIFFKPNTCIQDHGADVVIPKIAQDDQADYEGELCIIIG